jgi:hypothetical protein
VLAHLQFCPFAGVFGPIQPGRLGLGQQHYQKFR